MAGQSPEQQQDSPTQKVTWLLEALFWIWCLAGLSYFYYSQGFLTLFQQLWIRVIG